MNTEKETKLTTRKTLFIMAMDLIVVIMKLLSLCAIRQKNKDYLSKKARITLLAVTCL